jgi:hypothetical protein
MENNMRGLVQKCVTVSLLRAYRATELRVNMLKDNIEMDLEGIALMTK